MGNHCHAWFAPDPLGRRATLSFDKVPERAAPLELSEEGFDPACSCMAVYLPSAELALGSFVFKDTMTYRTDGLRSRLFDEEGDKQMVWDSQGSSGYQDLLQERLP